MVVRTRWRAAGWLALLLSGGAALPGQVFAQIPGDELPSTRRVRQEFLTSAFTDVKTVVTSWAESVTSGDARQAARLFTTDGLFSPPEGWYAQGRATVADSLTARLPRVRGYHTSFLDFTASGNLAYYLGRLRYSLDHPSSPRDVQGTFVMVLYQEGRTWRIRSYVERAG